MNSVLNSRHFSTINKIINFLFRSGIECMKIFGINSVLKSSLDSCNFRHLLELIEIQVWSLLFCLITLSFISWQLIQRLISTDFQQKYYWFIDFLVNSELFWRISLMSELTFWGLFRGFCFENFYFMSKSLIRLKELLKNWVSGCPLRAFITYLFITHHNTYRTVRQTVRSKRMSADIWLNLMVIRLEDTYFI